MNIDFERNETLRQSVRIKKKAPMPPVVPAEYRAQRNQVIKAQSFSSYTRPGMGNRVRDFVRPVVVAAIKKTTIEADDASDDEEDQSKIALRDIQRQINEIEYFSHHPKDTIPLQSERKFPEVNKTRYDEMESLLNTGISDVAPDGGFDYLASKQDETTDDDEQQKFHRGSTSRSTTGATSGIRQTSQAAVNIKLKSQRPATRTASESKQPIETLRPAVARYRDILNHQRSIVHTTVIAKIPSLQRIIAPPTVDINTQITNPNTKIHHLINNKRTVAREATDQVTKSIIPGLFINKKNFHYLFILLSAKYYFIFFFSIEIFMNKNIHFLLLSLRVRSRKM